MARLCKASRSQLSLRPGRTGWMVSSPLPRDRLRSGLKLWCSRVCPVHPESGRFFLQPGKHYLSLVLDRSLPIYHAEFHDCPRRRERLRRLEPFLHRAGSTQPLGVELFLPMALRLEAIGSRPEQSKLWQHMARDFDTLWERVPLFSLRLESWQNRVLHLLCQPVSRNQEEGTVSSKEPLCPSQKY